MSLSASGLYRFDEFELKPAQRTLTRNGTPVWISPKTFDVLAYLVANPGRVVTKDELLKAVWPESFVEEGNLTQHVFALRKALGDRAGCIVTIPGRGYQFTAQVETGNQPGAAPQAPQATHAVESLAHGTQSSSHVVIEEPSPAGSSPSTMRRLWRYVGGVILLTALLLMVWIAVRARRPSTLRIVRYQQITRDGRAKSIGGTDGSRVYFTEELPHTIAEVAVSGGPIEPVPVALNEPWAGDISPDGSTMLVVSQSLGMGPADSLWSFRLIGGSLRQLAGKAIAAAWSPDGSRVAYGTSTGDIFIIRSDGTDVQKLASPGGFIQSLSWSPDGSTIRFSKDGVLWELSTDGSMLRQLRPGWRSSSVQLGQWAQDGRYYFVSEGQIWVLRQRRYFGRMLEAEPVQLTSGPIAWSLPVPGRDGKTIFALGRAKRGELVRLDPRSKQFHPFLGGISAEFVAFTGDGKTVAYVTYPEGILWRANADGSNALQLTSPPVYPKSLRWSPDNTAILFVDRTPRGTSGIYTISAGGGVPHQLLPDDSGNETDPSWSPDGKKIVYSTCPTLGASSNCNLRILNVASGTTVEIPGSAGLLVPHWSPDGKYISAMTLDAMSMKVLSVKPGTWQNLATGSVAFPEWSHDSRFIYYLRWNGDAAVARMRLGDTKPEILADVGMEHFTGFYTSWMNLDSSDAPLFLRDMGSDEIYALSLQ